MQTSLLIPGLMTHPLVDGDLALDFKKFGEHRTLRVPAFHFRMVTTDTHREAGHINLRVISDEALLSYAGHIGYGVEESYRGRHFAARSVRLLMPLAYALELDIIWITSDPDNIASRRTCELAGAEFVDIVDVPRNTESFRWGLKQKCRYRLRLSNFEGSCARPCSLLAGAERCASRGKDAPQ
jgi:predicted acetyltransferase